MASHPAAEPDLQTLTDAEVDALVAGAVWYAKYHQRDLADLAGDGSASAVSRLEHFELLYAALAKLGVRVRRPVGLAPAAGPSRSGSGSER